MSERKRIVSDTGPLITLEKLSNGYSFIRKLYEKILVPPAVMEELCHGQFINAAAYLKHFAVTDFIEVVAVQRPGKIPEIEVLDEGEQEAVRLALELALPLLIEEEAGRQAAVELGLDISGIAGQILLAVRQTIISATEAERNLTELFMAGRISTRIYEGLLEIVQRSSTAE